MQGLHLVADLTDCRELALMQDAAALRERCRRAVTNAGLTIVGELFHAFPPLRAGQLAGVTGTVLLAESHLAVHTWPERRAVTLDVYVCNLELDNSQAAEAVLAELCDAFAPGHRQLQRLQRGGSDEATARGLQLDLEWLTLDAAFGLLRGPMLFDEQSAHQRVRVFDTPQFGRTLKVDQRFMTSEADEFFYHEALVHPAAIAHPAPQRAFVAGGGDGGAARELLRHSSIRHVVVAELDEAVVRASRTWLGRIHAGALDDARTDLRIGDAFAQLQAARRAGDRYDLVMFDLTDPDTPASPLYSNAAFDCVSDCMPDDGVFVVHLGSPTYHLATVVDLVQRLRERFAQVEVYGLFVPLYGCWWMFATASRSTRVAGLSQATVETRLRERGIGDCRFYTPAQHGALFVLPAFAERALARHAT
jgi:spermidine synthase